MDKGTRVGRAFQTGGDGELTGLEGLRVLKSLEGPSVTAVQTGVTWGGAGGEQVRMQWC